MHEFTINCAILDIEFVQNARIYIGLGIIHDEIIMTHNPIGNLIQPH